MAPDPSARSHPVGTPAPLPSSDAPPAPPLGKCPPATTWSHTMGPTAGAAQSVTAGGQGAPTEGGGRGETLGRESGGASRDAVRHASWPPGGRQRASTQPALKNLQERSIVQTASAQVMPESTPKPRTPSSGPPTQSSPRLWPPTMACCSCQRRKHQRKCTQRRRWTCWRCTTGFVPCSTPSPRWWPSNVASCCCLRQVRRRKRLHHRRGRCWRCTRNFDMANCVCLRQMRQRSRKHRRR